MVPRPAEADGRRGRAEALPANGGGRELRSLWRRLKEHGDPAARDRLVLHFAPLVKYVAGRMSSALPAHIEEGDLISYGLLGLMNAIERFDPSRQIKFETYAVTRIKGAIIDELRSLDWVPRSGRARAREIGEVLGVTESRVSQLHTKAILRLKGRLQGDLERLHAE